MDQNSEAKTHQEEGSDKEKQPTGAGGTLGNLFDGFYSRFILRDLFAKIVPGLVLLFAIASSLTWPALVVAYVARMSLWAWTAVGGLAWVLAFAIQSFGEKHQFIRYFPAKRGRNKEQIETEFHNLQLQFYQIASWREERQDERFVVIKEACGNGYLALSISLALLAVEGILYAVVNLSIGTLSVRQVSIGLVCVLPVFALSVLAVIYLRWMHFTHVERQYRWLEQTLAFHEHPPHRSEARANPADAAGQG